MIRSQSHREARITRRSIECHVRSFFLCLLDDSKVLLLNLQCGSFAWEPTVIRIFTFSGRTLDRISSAEPLYVDDK
jgi:hypothetical protein